MEEIERNETEIKDYAYGEPLSEKILSRNFTVPVHTKLRKNLSLPTDKIMNYIPIYKQLEIHEPIDIQRPRTPDLLVGKVRSWSRVTNSRQTFNPSDVLLPSSTKEIKLHSVMTSIKNIKSIMMSNSNNR